MKYLQKSFAVAMPHTVSDEDWERAMRKPECDHWDTESLNFVASGPDRTLYRCPVCNMLVEDFR